MKVTAAQVKRAFNDLTGPQYHRRHEAFDRGWRIAYHWCGDYKLALNDEIVANVTRGPRGGLSIKVL